MQPLTRTPVFT